MNMIEQSYFDIKQSRKSLLLAQLLTEHNPRLAIVFCNTRRDVDMVCNDLRAQGFCSAAIHGDVRQSKRDSIMKKFRNESVNILVATDVAARGIDVSNIEIIFNYGIPREFESYVHRVGRTGRAGKTGKAISLVSKMELVRLHKIMKFTKANIKRETSEKLPDLEFVFSDKVKPKVDDYSGTKDKEGKFRPTSRHFKKINSRIKKVNKNISSDYLLMIKGLVDDNNSLENVSAALLKMVVEGDNKPKKRIRGERWSYQS
jgi:ATP-dependent RNA helicase DeaD